MENRTSSSDSVSQPTAIEQMMMNMHSITIEEARLRLAANETVITEATRRLTGSRANTDVILAVIDVFRARDVDSLSAQDVTNYAHKLGLIPHANARAIGDTMGNHAGGLGFKSIKLNGRKHYLLNSRKAVPTGDEQKAPQSE